MSVEAGLLWSGPTLPRYHWMFTRIPVVSLQTKDGPGSEEEEEEEERPSMDLFKAVFASSSDDKSSSSSEEEDDDEDDKDEGERLAGAASLFNITPSVKSTTTSSAAVGPPGNDSLSEGRREPWFGLYQTAETRALVCTRPESTVSSMML